MRNFLVLFLIVVAATVSILGFRGDTFKRPPLEIFPDMDRQEKYKAQAESSFFSDGRTDRPVVAGSVPFNVEEEKYYPWLTPKDGYFEDDYYASGIIDGKFGEGFPVEITAELLERGQQRFEINCVVCHGEVGDGNGITKQYGIAGTPSFHTDMLRDTPEGSIYHTIVHGKNTMGPYGSKLTVEDRWAVVAYIRVLQRAGNATVEDVPQKNRRELGL